MSIHLTQQAKNEIKNALNDRGKGMGIRLAIKTTGCSGLSYEMEFVDSPDKNDEIVQVDDWNFAVVIDKKSLVYLKGIELDFVQDGVNQGFIFNNPNAKGSCGCGESFTV